MTKQQLGIQRIIERPGRAPYIRIEELVCPCCGCPTRHEWEQDTAKGYTVTETHCTNKGCRGYGMTSDVPLFFERFGSTAIVSSTGIYLQKEETK